MAIVFSFRVIVLTSSLRCFYYVIMCSCCLCEQLFPDQEYHKVRGILGRFGLPGPAHVIKISSLYVSAGQTSPPSFLMCSGPMVLCVVSW